MYVHVQYVHVTCCGGNRDMWNDIAHINKYIHLSWGVSYLGVTRGDLLRSYPLYIYIYTYTDVPDLPGDEGPELPGLVVNQLELHFTNILGENRGFIPNMLARPLKGCS
jgi:hypothetical protein